MKKEIIVTIQMEGIHFWPECPHEDVHYLRYPHRHIFHIECRKQVTDNDREIEIIMFKHKIEEFIIENYWSFNCCDFGTMSCEAIAEELYNEFQLTYCKVLEDGENGAAISR